MALSFFFAMLIYNLCRFGSCMLLLYFVWPRCREDKLRVKTGNAMIDDLGSEDLKALEEFYERMPLEARPQRNGEADAGDLALAQKLRAWCVQREGDCGAAAVVSKLCRLKGSAKTKAGAQLEGWRSARRWWRKPCGSSARSKGIGVTWWRAMASELYWS